MFEFFCGEYWLGILPQVQGRAPSTIACRTRLESHIALEKSSTTPEMPGKDLALWKPLPAMSHLNFSVRLDELCL